ncbi:ATP-grasp ribosomal peptide maturase [Streptomyces gilvifuscus]|jgi:ATP-grasp ribosomal peptide maturase|uniref:ATP-grasp ribosomal peptide maturase n=1 Tax=Streptomyces gilvifuscus TaxID=1550617 RepID=A0ABT5FKI3_9ACTN|nr:ATP-grasp ribosomal peptide maturase [Streptomyces gilvifuscus]MDC2953013.1 ATP-grasp ribosomal peptide maturase [Streptomyces gilvifuscus]
MASTVLVVTALEDVTADWVIAALHEREVPVVRMDPADIGPALTFGFRIGVDSPTWGGRLRTASREVELGEVAAVYYRRPTPYAARYEHLPARQQREFAAAEARHGLGGVLNDLHDALYVNHPCAVTRADFKPAQLQRFAELGLRIPPTLVTNDAETARKFAADHGPVVYKTFRGLPRSEDGRAGAIWAQRVDPDTFDDSLAVTAHLFQAEIPKTGDVRVTVVGRRVFAQRIAAPDRALDWRRGDWDDLIHAPITVPAPIKAALHHYLASFSLVFGCFDFALTGDGDAPEHWTAIECNPNGQWGWLPDAPAITEAFADILTRKEAAGDDDARRP